MLTDQQIAQLRSLAAAQVRNNATQLRGMLTLFGEQNAVDALTGTNSGGDVNGKHYEPGQLYALSLKVADVILEHCGIKKPTLSLKKTG